ARFMAAAPNHLRSCDSRWLRNGDCVQQPKILWISAEGPVLDLRMVAIIRGRVSGTTPLVSNRPSGDRPWSTIGGHAGPIGQLRSGRLGAASCYRAPSQSRSGWPRLPERVPRITPRETVRGGAKADTC